MDNQEIIPRLGAPEPAVSFDYETEVYSAYKVEKTVDALSERIAELEEALKLTNDELSKTIDEVNNSLKFNICSSDIDDPDYWDKQTCHENQILLKEQGE